MRIDERKEVRYVIELPPAADSRDTRPRELIFEPWVISSLKITIEEVQAMQRGLDDLRKR